MFTYRRARAIAVCLVAAPLFSTPVSAEKMDGSRDIVCAVMDVVGCLEEGGCIEGSARSFELPEFIIMDAKKKQMRASYESGEKAISSIKHMEHSEGHFVIQGVENSRGWGIAIDTDTGRMSGSGVGDGVSFLAFGACTIL